MGMTRLLPSITIAPLLALALTVSGCGGAETSPPADPDPDAAESSIDGPVAEDAPEEAAPDEGDVAPDAEDTYLTRLTPVALIRQATEIRVEGKDAWVTVPADSSSVLECLQMLPAVMPDETLTVIYSDGVEEQCEWPDEE